MTKVNFYDSINDSMLKFAVIIARHNGKWVFCKHKERNTWEAPGGHREAGEDILETAKRELYEETGAITFEITPICIYSVTAPDNFDGRETFGKLFFADIHTFEKELHSEIEKIAIMDELPINWTYPEIQPKLLEEARKRGFLPKKEVKMLFLCYPKCSTCQKAKKWLEEQNINYTERNIAENNPSYEELKEWYTGSGLPLKRFFNTSGLLYKEMKLKDKLPTMSEDEQLKLLATNGMLVKRPLLIDENTVLVGFKEAEWRSLIE